MKAKLTATLIFLVLIPAAASARIIFWADFENGIPSDWTVVGSVPAWGTASNACLVTNYGSFWDDISGDFAAVNNLCENYGLGSFAALISNVVDLTHFSDAYIYFDHDFLLDNGVVSGDFSVSPSSAADADVIGTYNDTAVGDATESFDLSLLGYGDGNPFFYVGWEYWIGATADPTRRVSGPWTMCS
ncbi:MAG: hypothetical protein M5R36_17635 [Deltaproteobacteria bacterium]|nr:hypothetical protein [Deltaproteobacteria bacterium]